MLLVKYFLGEVYKLREFLIQIKIKITNKGPGLPMAIKQVAYAGLFLTERALEWFEPYFTEVQLNKFVGIRESCIHHPCSRCQDSKG